MLEKLEGYKTYIVAAGVVGYGLYMGFFGGMGLDAIEWVFSGAALATVRNTLDHLGLKK